MVSHNLAWELLDITKQLVFGEGKSVRCPHDKVMLRYNACFVCRPICIKCRHMPAASAGFHGGLGCNKSCSSRGMPRRLFFLLIVFSSVVFSSPSPSPTPSSIILATGSTGTIGTSGTRLLLPSPHIRFSSRKVSFNFCSHIGSLNLEPAATIDFLLLYLTQYQV